MDRSHAERDRAGLDALSAEDFDELPHGLARLNADRSFVVANLAAVEMLGDVAAQSTTCCEVLGCHTDGTPLEGICLTEHALESGEALPEVRVDIPIDDPSTAVWITSAPLSRGSGVMIHLRPGEVNDRRRRTDPTWLSSDRLHICALGRTSIDRGGVSLDGDWVHQRPGQLLKYLICERNRHVTSEEIADAIWPMSDHRAGVGRVRHYVHAIRDRLEPERERHSPSGYILARNRGYALAHERLTVDVDRFESHASYGREALDAGSLGVAHRHLDQANALYRGEFLADEPFADWAMAERERLHDIATGVLRDLTDIAIGQGQLARAATYLNRLATLQPFDVEIHREVISMCLRRGRKSEAMRRYSTLKARMQRQFDEELTFTVADVQEALDTSLRLA